MDGEHLGRIHAELVEHLEAMDATAAGDPALPSLLPGWTRGHVLTHVARNADSFSGMLAGGERGESVAQYPGGEQQRSADIERGATRPWFELVDDVRTASDALDGAIAAQTRWDVPGLSIRGIQVPLADLAFRRFREVLIHHADLGDPGFTPGQWPVEYVRDELRRQTMAWDARRPMGATGLPRLALAVPELKRLLWLLGRTEIDGLEPAGVF